MTRKEFKRKSREVVREATDIVLNTESDEAAVDFLRDTLGDDFSHMELGSMNLHEAIEVLGIEDSSKSRNMMNIENLNETLNKFMNKTGNSTKKKSKRKSRRRRKKK